MRPTGARPSGSHYTLQLADLLAAWLPEEIDGSISTVPCSFKPWITSRGRRAGDGATISPPPSPISPPCARTPAREIHLGLEPEPDCYLETTAETIAFFKDVLFTAGVAEVARILKCYRSDGRGS